MRNVHQVGDPKQVPRGASQFKARPKVERFSPSQFWHPQDRYTHRAATERLKASLANTMMWCGPDASIPVIAKQAYLNGRKGMSLSHARRGVRLLRRQGFTTEETVYRHNSLHHVHRVLNVALIRANRPVREQADPTPPMQADPPKSFPKGFKDHPRDDSRKPKPEKPENQTERVARLKREAHQNLVASTGADPEVIMVILNLVESRIPEGKRIHYPGYFKTGFQNHIADHPDWQDSGKPEEGIYQFTAEDIPA